VASAVADGSDAIRNPIDAPSIPATSAVFQKTFVEIQSSGLTIVAAYNSST